jgi:hypothetical protein
MIGRNDQSISMGDDDGWREECNRLRLITNKGKLSFNYLDFFFLFWEMNEIRFAQSFKC